MTKSARNAQAWAGRVTASVNRYQVYSAGCMDKLAILRRCVPLVGTVVYMPQALTGRLRCRYRNDDIVSDRTR